MKNLLIISIILLASCKKSEERINYDDGTYSIVYRIKDTAYFNYVPVVFDIGRNKIVMYTDEVPFKYQGSCFPVPLDSGYYYESSERQTCGFALGGIRTAVIDIRIVDYELNFNMDTMINHLLCKEVMAEYYYSEFRYGIEGCNNLEEDTALINSWIRKGELGNHLKRLK
jgi:hypothetical protein